MAPAPDSPLSSLTGLLDARTRKSLASAGFRTVGDLLVHYPFRYEDRRRFDGWPSEETGEAVCLRGKVTDTVLKRFRGRRAMVEVTLEDVAETGFGEPLVCRWFNMPYLHRSFAADQEVIVYGRPKRAGSRRLVLDHPEFEILTGDAEDAEIHLQRLTPIYRAREGVPQKTLRRAMFRILGALADDIPPDVLPATSGDSGFAGLTRAAAIREIHFPSDPDRLQAARRYLALEEFFALQVNVLHRRARWSRLTGPGRCGPGDWLETWRRSLPFPLTGAQERAIAEIRSDLASPEPMNRMLQGDVGSGKTFVAMAAMLLAVESGCQAVLMAPTQILAEQHYRNFRNWLQCVPVRISLRTGARQEDGFLPLFSGGGEEPQILIGTHALLHGDPQLTRPGLVVIDEQHRFGVEQRARLVSRGTAPDVLVMSATPIPRTLTMTLYGDLDVSILDELPPGRGRVVTALRENPDPSRIASFLHSEFAAGHQAYLVYPAIDESGSLTSLRAATSAFEEWQARLPDRRFGLLHGRMKPAEKDDVMRRFRDGAIDALVTTSIIEVGVDVPSATVMIVFGADRFGLAQLHQLRGRIGRGAHKSWCILTVENPSPDATRRLQILEQTTDGFAVAEADLLLRGPGDLLGTAQSGLPDLHLGDLLRDASLVRTARRLAESILTTDPDLQQPANRHLRDLLVQDPPASNPHPA